MCVKPKKAKEKMFSDAEIYQKVLDCFPNHAFENMKRYHGIKITFAFNYKDRTKTVRLSECDSSSVGSDT